MNQKLEELLRLALQTPEAIRLQTEELNVGFDSERRTWELIVKYHGNLDGLAALGIVVEYLIAGYAILTVPEALVEVMAALEEIEYVEMPKRYFYGQTTPTRDSCLEQVTSRGVPNVGSDDGRRRGGLIDRDALEQRVGTPGGGRLSGFGVLVAVLDSGERVIIMSS